MYPGDDGIRVPRVTIAIKYKDIKKSIFLSRPCKTKKNNPPSAIQISTEQINITRIFFGAIMYEFCLKKLITKFFMLL